MKPKDRTYYSQCNSRELIDAARYFGDDLAQVLADRLEALLDQRNPAPHSDQALERAERLRALQIEDLQRMLMKGARDD